MITKTEGYKTSDGAVHGCIEEAIARELSLITEDAKGGDTVSVNPLSNSTGIWIARNREKIVSILSVEAPKKRTRKPRAAKTATQQPLTP